MKQTFIPRRSLYCLFALGLLGLTVNETAAQEAYRFRCRDYVTGDAGRVPQTAFSYDDEDNTFTVNASGLNNVALQMDKQKDGAYYIRNMQEWFLVRGTNLGAVAGNSYIWWFNGFNGPAGNASTAPNYSVADEDGAFESQLGRVADGVANRVDRLKAIGNGQVPLVAARAFVELKRRLLKL